MIFQSYTLYPWMTVAANVEFGLKLQGHSKAERHEQAATYLDIVGLSDFANAYPKELSGFCPQRVAIARALVCQPQILLMDEPFGALDVQTKETMQQFLLKIWQRTKTTILMITHDISEAIFLSQRVYVLTKQPGTVQREVKIKLPARRIYKIRHHPDGSAYYEEIYELIRGG
jgi:NitT/TauT family transport system ATP-binding protein